MLITFQIAFAGSADATLTDSRVHRAGRNLCGAEVATAAALHASLVELAALALCRGNGEQDNNKKPAEQRPHRPR